MLAGGGSCLGAGDFARVRAVMGTGESFWIAGTAKPGTGETRQDATGQR